MKPSPLLRALGFASVVVGWAGAGCSSGAGAQPSDAGGGGDAGGETVVYNPLCLTSPDDVLSDFTSGNGLALIDGRRGGWFTYADKSGAGTLTPPEGGAALPDITTGNPTCSGPGSLHVTAVNFTDWGAAMAVDLVPKVPDADGVMVKGNYDASRYRGIAFWAKAATPIKFVQVKFNDPWTDIPSVLPYAEQCVFNTMMPDKNCSPYIVKLGYGWEVTGADGGSEDATVAATWPTYANKRIDTDWRRFEIRFADARQDPRNPGQKSPDDRLDVSRLMGIAIQVNSDHATTPPTPNNFEIWVDDVVLIR